jgi:hypothetical protein
MKSIARTTTRLQRMQRECAGAAGQARSLGLALAVLVGLLALTGLLG